MYTYSALYMFQCIDTYVIQYVTNGVSCSLLIVAKIEESADVSVHEESLPSDGVNISVTKESPPTDGKSKHRKKCKCSLVLH